MRNEILDKLERFGDRTAVIDGGVEYSYTDLVRRIHSQREWLLDHDVQPGDPVVLHGDYSFTAIATLLTLYLHRAIAIPVTNLTAPVRTAITEWCRPQHLITSGAETRIEKWAAPAGTTDPYARLRACGAAGLVLLSSGSTGAPKAILHNFDLLVEQKVGAGTRIGRNAAPVLMFLLFDHIGGINSLLGVLRTGATAVLTHRRTPEDVCALIERHRIRLLPTSPTFLNLVLVGGFHEKYDLSSLRMITYGTEVMPEGLLRRARAALGRVKLLQTFGTSETGVATTVSKSSSSTYFTFSGADLDHRVVDGELQLRSRTHYLGYLNYSDDARTHDGWFRTGDLVEHNEDGFIRIAGRTKELINVGGEKVLPTELESILLDSPLIVDCLVYGAANSITGQSVCVDLELRSPMTSAEARRHVRALLTGKVEQFKMPTKVAVVDRLAVTERFKKKRTRE